MWGSALSDWVLYAVWRFGGFVWGCTEMLVMMILREILETLKEETSPTEKAIAFREEDTEILKRE